MIVTLLWRRGTSSAWASADPVLANGEVGLDTTAGRTKVGDGSSAWSALGWSSLSAEQILDVEELLAGGGGGGGGGTGNVSGYVFNEDTSSWESAPAMRLYLGGSVDDTPPGGETPALWAREIVAP